MTPSIDLSKNASVDDFGNINTWFVFTPTVEI
jgi:hypothetical protein